MINAENLHHNVKEILTGLSTCDEETQKIATRRESLEAQLADYRLDAFIECGIDILEHVGRMVLVGTQVAVIIKVDGMSTDSAQRLNCMKLQSDANHVDEEHLPTFQRSGYFAACPFAQKIRLVAE